MEMLNVRFFVGIILREGSPGRVRISRNAIGLKGPFLTGKGRPSAKKGNETWATWRGLRFHLDGI